MLKKINTRYKPLYKQFIKLRTNIQGRHKVFKFKKQKWKQFLYFAGQKLKRYKKFKPQDQTRYFVSFFPSRGASYQKRYRNNQNNVKNLKVFYGGLLRKQLRNLIQKSLNKRSIDFNLTFLKIIEKRLDVTLTKAKFAHSVRSARQLINHKKVYVNGKIVKSKSYLVQPGDLISINKRCKKLIEHNVQLTSRWPIPPKYLTINYKIMQIMVGSMEHLNVSSNFSYYFNLEKILTSRYRY